MKVNGIMMNKMDEEDIYSNIRKKLKMIFTQDNENKIKYMEKGSINSIIIMFTKDNFKMIK